MHTLCMYHLCGRAHAADRTLLVSCALPQNAARPVLMKPHLHATHCSDSAQVTTSATCRTPRPSHMTHAIRRLALIIRMHIVACHEIPHLLPVPNATSKRYVVPCTIHTRSCAGPWSRPRRTKAPYGARDARCPTANINSPGSPQSTSGSPQSI